jgi:preprotein translocase subunit SecY
MQLCTVVIPSLEALKKEGEAGRRKITQYTRYATLGLAFFQAVAISAALERRRVSCIAPGLTFRIISAVTLVTGTMFLMWLGEQITERGLGNGSRSSSSPASPRDCPTPSGSRSSRRARARTRS